jgi:hypothetical protein
MAPIPTLHGAAHLENGADVFSGFRTCCSVTPRPAPPGRAERVRPGSAQEVGDEQGARAGGRGCPMSHHRVENPAHAVALLTHVAAPKCPSRRRRRACPTRWRHENPPRGLTGVSTHHQRRPHEWLRQRPLRRSPSILASGGQLTVVVRRSVWEPARRTSTPARWMSYATRTETAPSVSGPRRVRLIGRGLRVPTSPRCS